MIYLDTLKEISFYWEVLFALGLCQLGWLFIFGFNKPKLKPKTQYNLPRHTKTNKFFIERFYLFCI